MTGAAEQLEHRRSGEAVHNVRDQDCIVTIRDRVLEEISLDNPKAVREWAIAQTPTGGDGNRWQIVQGSFHPVVMTERRCQKRSGAATEIQHATMLTKFICRGQRLRRPACHRFDAFGVQLLLLRSKLPVDDPVRSNGLFQLHPPRIAHVIPEAQEGTQVGGRAAAQEGPGSGPVPVLVALSLHEAQRDHGIRDYAQGSRRYLRTPRDGVKGCCSVGQALKQSYLTGNE